MTTKKGFYARKFLNKPGHHTVASVLAKVAVNGEMQFTLSDCDRTINLEFTTYSKTGRINSLYKIQTLLEVLAEFKKELEVYYESHPIENNRDY